MSEIVLHIYDVTNSASTKTNSAIVQLNRIMKDAIGLGGVFHSAVEVYGEEWSFGFCENGTGVFCCPPKKNPMYTYRESIVLGYIDLSADKVSQILTDLGDEWHGCSYDLLAKNCNHFCDVFCKKLGVQKLPPWVNRFANAGDTAFEVAETTAVKLRQAKTEIISASKVAYRFLVGTMPSANASESQGSSQAQKSGTGVLSGSWLKNLSSLRLPGNSQDASSASSRGGISESDSPIQKGSDSV